MQCWHHIKQPVSSVNLRSYMAATVLGRNLDVLAHVISIVKWLKHV